MPSAREDRYRQTIFRLFVFLEAFNSHSEGDALWDEAASKLLAVIEVGLGEEPSLLVQSRQGFLFLNGVRVPVSGEGYAAVEHIVRLLHRQSKSGLEFANGVDLDGLKGMASTLCEGKQPTEHPEHPEHPEHREHWPGVSFMDVQEPEDLGLFGGSSQLPPATSLKQTHFKSVFVVKSLMDRLDTGGLVDLSTAKRIVQRVVDLVLGETPILSWLEAQDREGGSLLRHGINVCVYSILLGEAAGVSQKLLDELSVAALLHDMGRFVGEPDTASSERTSDHTQRGFRRLIAEDGQLSDLMMRAALVCAQHHLDSGSGDGQRWNREGPSFLASIVRVAEAYDNLRHANPSATLREIFTEVTSQAQQGTLAVELVDLLGDVLIGLPAEA